MRAQLLVALFFVPGLAGFGQTAPTPAPQGLPKDPRAIFAAAASFYDFSDPALKPWHLKATYQLYDDRGQPAEQGTFEYWWASPKVYRSTWTRPSATHTDWYTADGRHAHQATGSAINFFEYKLKSALLAPLPDRSDLEPAKFRLDREEEKLGSVKFPCIMVVPLMPQHGQIQTVPLGLFPTYCFDPNLPVLRISYSFGTVAMEFNNIAKVQNHFLAREILFFEGRRQILSAKVESMNGIAPSDAALTPAADAHVERSGQIPIDGRVAVGMLVKKEFPVYPQDAKDARVSGKVVLTAIIGTDGRIHDLRVEEAPWPSLAASAIFSVSQWQYKPYLLNGEPVEVETTVNVIFSLGP